MVLLEKSELRDCNENEKRGDAWQSNKVAGVGRFENVLDACPGDDLRRAKVLHRRRPEISVAEREAADHGCQDKCRYGFHKEYAAE